jgi:hypothetical protein
MCVATLACIILPPLFTSIVKGNQAAGREELRVEVERRVGHDDAIGNTDSRFDALDGQG